MQLVRNSWIIPVGKTYRGKTVLFDFLDLPHMKVAGVTKSGKSAFMKWLLFTLAIQHSEEHLHIYIIDLKGGATFAPWEHLPHVKGVYSDIDEARAVLEGVKNEMERRNQMLKLSRYNFKDDPNFPHILVLIDEGGEMAPKEGVGKVERELRMACMSALSSLARVGREPRIHILYGTQRPDANTLPTNIRSQMEATFCFRVQEDIDSRIVIRHNGAEKLEHIPGRMIFQTPDKEILVQAPYLSDKVVTNWLRTYADKVPETVDVPGNMSLPDGVSDWM